MSSVLTCIECPRGCRLSVEKGKDGYVVDGNRCPKGKDYAVRESECPMRVLTTTIRTAFPDIPRLPVRTNREIPLREIFLFMEKINRFTLTERVPHGSEIDCSLPRGIKLLVTGDTRPASRWKQPLAASTDGGHFR